MASRSYDDSAEQRVLLCAYKRKENGELDEEREVVISVPLSWLENILKEDFDGISVGELLNTYIYDDSDHIMWRAEDDGVLRYVEFDDSIDIAGQIVTLP